MSSRLKSTLKLIKSKTPGSVSLRFRDFRLYWTGQVISVSGQQMSWVAQGWLIYELTGSKLLLGAAGLAQAIPSTLLTLLGGVAADKFDQRRLLIWIQILQALLLSLLATLCVTETVQIWHLFAIITCTSAIGSFENPTRSALFPHLLERHALLDAVALNSTVHPGTRMVAPAIGGLLLGQVTELSSAMAGAGVIYFLTAAGFAVSALMIWMVKLPPVKKAGKSSVAHDLTAGLKFIAKNHIFAFLIGMTYSIQFFGAAAQSLFPVFAKDILHTNASGLGFLYSALGVGSLLGAILSASLVASRKRGLYMIGGIIVTAIFFGVFAFSTVFAISLAALAVSGAGQAMFNVAAQSTLQILVPNDLRGRVMGVWALTHSSIQPMGQLTMGGTAALFSAPIAVFLGAGILLAIGLFLAAPNKRARDVGKVVEMSARPSHSYAPDAESSETKSLL